MLSKYDGDERNLTQDGYVDDTDFGQKTVERYPAPRTHSVNDDTDYEVEKDEVNEDLKK